MAHILYPDGRDQEVQPANGHDFQLKEMQDIVGGYIQILTTKDQRIMIINDEGKLLDLPRNEQATELINFPKPEEIQEMLRAYPEIIFAGDPNVEDYIAGTVLVCEDHEVE